MASPLAVVWTVAIGLAALSSATMAALILARLRRTLVERKDPERRARITKALIHYALADGETPTFDLRNHRERSLIAEIALDAAAIMRGAARARLVDFLASVGLDRQLRRQARRGRMNERIAALEALRLFPNPQTLKLLQRAEHSHDLRICLAALRALTEVGASPAINELLALAARPDAHKSPALGELIYTCAAANLPDALAAFESKPPREARLMLARALGDTGEIAALASLMDAADDPDPEVRAAVIGALGALGFNDAVPALAAATEDGDWRVRLRAAEALGRLSAGFHAPYIERLLHDEVWWVRHRAEETLRKLRDDAVVQLARTASPQGSARDGEADAATRSGVVS
jgi:HEAT repeat protein